MATTRKGNYGAARQPYGTFAGKEPSDSPASDDRITRQNPMIMSMGKLINR